MDVRLTVDVTEAASSMLHGTRKSADDTEAFIVLHADLESGLRVEWLDESQAPSVDQRMCKVGDHLAIINNAAAELLGENSRLDYSPENESFTLYFTSEGEEVILEQWNRHATCSHVQQLPQVPAPEELPALRKGLRKQKPPELSVGWHGEHSKVGRFRINEGKNGNVITWSTPGQPERECSVQDLCNNPNNELDRLEFGWIVANLAQLDKFHQSESVNMGHPVYEMEERARVWTFFEKIEKRWRHWALVPSGHMILPEADRR